MPRRFRSFLKKKDGSKGSPSRNNPRYSSDSEGVDKYEYGVDYGSNGRKKPKGNTRWTFSERLTKKQEVLGQRSSRSLGDAEVKGRLMGLLDDSFDGSEDDDYFEATKFVERKFSPRQRVDSDEDDDDETESTDGMQALDRACVRLDGIEVYAIVSALTCATAISCFDNYNPTPLTVIINERAVFTLLSEMFYYLSGALGMMTGLHATLIFSLVTMYGRTALGIDRDESFNEFFANTGPARFNGFWSFKLSLYCFMTQLSFLIGQKFFFEPLRPLVLLVTGYLAYTNLYCDAEDVLRAASVIYSTPAEPTPPSEEEEDAAPVDRRQSMIKNRRASMKKGGPSLSTRNFGIDNKRRSFVFSKSPAGYINEHRNSGSTGE